MGQEGAADTVLRDWEDFVNFYHYPKDHLAHLRSSNPIESIFSGERLRIDAARRVRCRNNDLYLVLKMVERSSGHWRALNGSENLMRLVLKGLVFKDGVRQRRDADQPVPAAALLGIGWKGFPQLLTLALPGYCVSPSTIREYLASEGLERPGACHLPCLRRTR